MEANGPLLREHTGSGDWNYWSKVFGDGKLTETIAQRDHEPPRPAHPPSRPASNTCEVIFRNVPRIGVTQTGVVRHLVASQVRGNLPIGHILISNRRWILQLFKKSDAVELARRLDGFRFRGKLLLVFTSIPNGGNKFVEDPQNKIEQNENNVSKKSETRLKSFRSNTSKSSAVLRGIEEVQVPSALLSSSLQVAMDRDAVWTRRELAELATFKRELSSALSRREGACCPLSSLQDMPRMRRRGLVSASLTLWPLGLSRLFPSDFRVTGRLVSLIGKDDAAAMHRRTSADGVSGVALAEWEPIPGTHLRNESQLVSYISAFLSFFGPQHVKIDVPWRLLVQVLRPLFGVTPSSLACKVVAAHAGMIVYNDVIYLVSSAQHRQLLLSSLQPNPPSSLDW